MRLKTFLFGAAGCVLLTGCALKIPPFGADILPGPARDEIPGQWSGPHRRGPVVPNWISSFGDPELSALVAEAIERNPDLRAAAARVEASRYAVRGAALSFSPGIGAKIVAISQGTESSGDFGFGLDPPS